jgi:hypothetical protein
MVEQKAGKSEGEQLMTSPDSAAEVEPVLLR